MQAVDLMTRSPLHALATAIRGGLMAGEIGAVMARPGVGKSAFLVQVALDALLRGADVLHVSLDHPQSHVRAYYDELFGSFFPDGRGGAHSDAALAIERHRVIHSCLNKSFGPADLQALLTTLQGVMDFQPAVVVVDGLEASSLEVAEWLALASSAKIRLWLSIRTHREGGPRASDMAERFTTAVLLDPDGSTVQLHVLRQNGRVPTDLPPVKLDPTTLLVQMEQGGLSRTPVVSPSAGTCSFYSTGAGGAEAAFGAAAERWGMNEVNFTCDGHEQARERGSRPLSDRELAAGNVSLVYVSRRLNRNWNDDENVRRVLQLLWQVVSHAQQIFVIGSIQEDGTVHGGTGWSVELARRWHKRVWVFDQGEDTWFTWDGKTWIPDTPVIGSTRFAGTGTRHLTDNGRAAIDDLFQRSFGPQA